MMTGVLQARRQPKQVPSAPERKLKSNTAYLLPVLLLEDLLLFDELLSDAPILAAFELDMQLGANRAPQLIAITMLDRLARRRRK